MTARTQTIVDGGNDNDAEVAENVRLEGGCATDIDGICLTLGKQKMKYERMKP